MLFSNWIITQNLVSAPTPENISVGICLDIQSISLPFSDLLYALQKLNPDVTISILITDKMASLASDDLDKCLDNLLSLFYQPGFYIKNEAPVVFLSATGSQASFFMDSLEKACLDQGYKQLYTIRLVPIIGEAKVGSAPIAYEVSQDDLNYTVLIDNWINNCLKDHNQWPITLLISENQKHDLLESILQKQKTFMNEKHFAVANVLYELIKKNEEYKFQLYLKSINEQNNLTFLEFQKQDLAKILDFYKYEYEILPLWYKRFGHVIKVLIGKRTFKSLFSDNVKKYNKS